MSLLITLLHLIDCWVVLTEKEGIFTLSQHKKKEALCHVWARFQAFPVPAYDPASTGHLPVSDRPTVMPGSYGRQHWWRCWSHCDAMRLVGWWCRALSRRDSKILNKIFVGKIPCTFINIFIDIFNRIYHAGWLGCAHLLMAIWPRMVSNVDLQLWTKKWYDVSVVKYSDVYVLLDRCRVVEIA